MARVSRKNKVEVVEQINERIYNVAIYTRLSVLDGGINNPESILTQQYFVEQFVNSQKDMRIIDRYSDNGFTGVNFERPDFERMMDDVRAKKIDCIAVKDLSRFSRNYVETGYFLEKIFPFLDVRFIAITDGYDTAKNTDGNDMVVSIKNIVNNIYAKDLSKKITTVFKEKQEKGEFINGSAPFGYSKCFETKPKLIVNPETAPIIQRIFKLRLDGLGYSAIANVLNEERIITPVMYNFLSGKYRHKPVKDTAKMWKIETIKKIMENKVYIGHMETRKRIQSLHDGTPLKWTNEDERVIVYNTHEPIISVEDFSKVQDINKAVREKYASQMGKYPLSENIFKGLIFCSDCGVRMTRYKGVSKSKNKAVRYTFGCTNYRTNIHTDKPCTHKLIGEPELKELIIKSIQINMQLASDLVEKLSSPKNSKKQVLELKKLSDKIFKSKKKLTNINLRKTQLFERYADSTLSFSEYSKLKAEYEEKSLAIETEIKNLEMFEIEYNSRFTAKNKWIMAFLNKDEVVELTREILLEFVERIEISEYNTVTIRWKYADELQALLKHWEVQV